MIGEKEAQEFIEAQKNGELSNSDLVSFINMMSPEERELLATRQMPEAMMHELKVKYKNKMVKDWRVK